MGIDPGFATTGFGLVEINGEQIRALDYGVITTEKGIPHGERIRQTIDDLLALIAEFSPDEIAMEELFFSKNTKTALKVAESRGAILYALGRKHRLPSEYKPNQIKMNVCGYGGAPKIQVQKMVQLLLELDGIPRPDDAADALAIALCHANHLKTNIQFQQ